MRIGCSTITFGPLPSEQALQRIADLGFTVIDIAAVPGHFDHVNLLNPAVDEVERIAASVHRHSFDVAGVQSVPWLPDAIDDPDELRRRYTVVANVAQAVGARAWVVDAGSAQVGQVEGRDEALSRFKRTITMAAELADQRGLRLGIEAPHAGTLAETLPEVVELLDFVDLPELGVDLDTSHMFSSAASTSELVNEVGHRVAHVALRDASYDGGFGVPGDGDFDFLDFFAALAKAGYTGDAMLELEPSRQDASADDRAMDAARAREYLESLLAYGGPSEP
ncbi:sugar phosphate isomerase/epimerase family protein [Phytoactinopolyspora endophytica]|uniref:sugar phosphate isomerase/epimerase family protein n=1 Tax=Phytoactinopolyspora endophytica TaxID=1642495 RepID=UPI0013EDB14C|nr:sugar phosphate isomerase/epimerase [Phytoactinopolyspora endophytica]